MVPFALLIVAFWKLGEGQKQPEQSEKGDFSMFEWKVLHMFAKVNATV